MKLFFIVGWVLLKVTFAFSEPIDLKNLLEKAYQNNPGLKALHSEVNAEKAMVSSRATLDDPMLGISRLNRNVTTQYGTFSQRIRFPIKYFLQAKAQSSRVDALKARETLNKLSLREKVISFYYEIYSIQKIILLTQANMQALKEFARVAEKKYAAGKSPQADSMKAHFELTHLELELIRLKQQEASLQDHLKALFNQEKFQNISLESRTLPNPQFFSQKMDLSLSGLLDSLKDHSPKVKEQKQNVKEAEYKQSLAKWEYAPDFQFQYQQRISGEPEDSKIYSVAMSFPIWFWKKSADASAASSYRMVQEYRLSETLQKTLATVKDLKKKVETGVKTLKIYETSLIPQAQGAYNSTRASYRANKTSFLDLLDSERSLYQVRKDYYQAFQQYVKSLSQLETQLGFSVSTLEQ